MNLRELQLKLPWSIRYSADFRANPQPHKDFAHALTHIHKAAGQLSALVDDMDHRKDTADNSAHVAEYDKYIADLVICAMRMANTRPGGVLDLEKAVVDRIESKNGVKLFGIDMASKKDITTSVKVEMPDFFNAIEVHLKYLRILASGKMTRQEVDRRWEIETAYARGVKIEGRFKGSQFPWMSVIPNWNWDEHEYRIAPAFHGITIKAVDYLPPDCSFFVSDNEAYNFGGVPTKGVFAVTDKYNELLLTGKLGVNEVRHQMPVEVAYARGKAIQMYHDPSHAWLDMDHPSFRWDMWDYRVKPE